MRSILISRTNKRKFQSSLLLVISAACANYSFAETLAWTPQLENVEGGVRKPDSAFRIEVPDTLPQQQLLRLALELDGIDVTAMITRENQFAVFRPAEALAYGRHTLRIVYYSEQGDIEELANWEIEIRKSGLFREASLEADAVVTRTRIVSPEDYPGDKDNTESSLNLNAKVAEGGWQGNMRLAMTGNSNIAQLENGDNYALTEYLISANNNNFTGQLGHHSINHTSLVMPSFANRGASAQYTTDDKRYSFTAFSMYRNPISGFSGGMGLATSTPSIDGMYISAFPLVSDPQKYYLSLIYLQGEDETLTASSAAYTVSAPQHGDAMSMQAEARLVDKQLRLGMEIASATVQSDGGTTTTSSGYSYTSDAYARRDQAYSIYAIWQKETQENNVATGNWQLGLEHKLVGVDFHSIANTVLPADRSSWKLFSNINRQTYAIQAAVGIEQDNVENVAELPTTRKNIYTLNSSWAPELKQDENNQPIYGTLGQQNYSLLLSREQREQIRQGTGSLAIPVMDQTDTLGISASFRYPGWAWNLVYNTSHYQDETNYNPDTILNSSALSVNLPLHKKLNLIQNWQKNQWQNCDTGQLSNEIMSVTQIQSELIESKLNASLQYLLNDTRTIDDTVNNSTEALQARLTWTVHAARENHPGVRLHLSAIDSTVSDHLLDSEARSRQVYLGITVGIPVRY